MNPESACRYTAPERIVELRPRRAWLDLDLGEIWRYRELLLALVGRELKVRYRQAVIGAAWAVIQPVFAVLVFTVVFGHFARMPSDDLPYPLFAFAAMLPWTYFAEALRRSATGPVAEAELVRKVYFPRLVVPLAMVIAPLVDFALSFVVFLAMLAWYGAWPGWSLLLVVPLTILAMALSLSIGLWLGPVNVRFRDVMHTLPFVLQIWLYASPIVYPLSIVPEPWRLAYSLNPMVGLIEGFRWSLLGRGSADPSALAVSAAVVAALLAGGVVFFRRAERRFADLI